MRHHGIRLLGLLCLPLAGLAGCGGEDNPPPFCPEGQVRQDGLCTPYVPGDPVDATGLWEPPIGTTWQWQITGSIDASRDVEMYDVDLFEVTDSAPSFSLATDLA
jgi:hypothetical protein